MTLKCTALVLLLGALLPLGAFARPAPALSPFPGDQTTSGHATPVQAQTGPLPATTSIASATASATASGGGSAIAQARASSQGSATATAAAAARSARRMEPTYTPVPATPFPSFTKPVSGAFPTAGTQGSMGGRSGTSKGAVAGTGTAASSTAAAGGGSCPDIQATLQAHNAARARYGASPLTWSATLAQHAQGVANTCVMQHSQSSYGENLAMGSSLRTCASAVAMWMREEGAYAPGSGFSSRTGHFTQVVWKGTTEVGCGLSSCGLVACNYNPPGNMMGAFDANV